MPIGSFAFLPVDKIIFGPGSVSRLPDEIDRLGAGRVLVVTGRTIAQKTALLAEIRDLLADHFAGSYIGVQQHTPSANVTGICEEMAHLEADAVVSLGGGSVIDATKAATLARARDTGSFIPHIALPTTLSASEVSPLFGVTDEATKQKAGGNNPFVTPRVAILDANLTLHTPDHLWLSSGIRALDHAVETIYAPDHQAVTDATSLEAIRLLFEFLPRSTGAESLEARHQCQMAAWLSFFGVANITLGLSHMLGRQIGPRYNVAHGDTSAVLLPHVMAAMLPEGASRLALIGHAAGAVAPSASTEEAAEAAPRAVSGLVNSLGLPSTLRDLGVPRNDLEILSGGSPDVLAVLEAAW